MYNNDTVSVASVNPFGTVFHMTLSADTYIGTSERPTLNLTSRPWMFTGGFSINDSGKVTPNFAFPGSLAPSFTNPGYLNGDTFKFNESVHGFIGYTFELSLTGLAYSSLGPRPGWETNLKISELSALSKLFRPRRYPLNQG